jgi:hypothetical protein
MEMASIILAGVGALLLAAVWPAWQRERQRRLPEERQWECATIDVAPLVHRVEQVRSDYIGARPPFHAGRLFHEQLLDAARRTVSNLSFFRCRRDEPDHKHPEQITA